MALYLLGPPRLEVDGEVVHISRRKAVALLAYLAVTGRPHSRDSLATLLWPELDQSTSRARLRRALAALREAISGDWLDADRETVAFNPDVELWLDVDVFHDRVAACEAHGHPPPEACPDCLPLLEEAVALYRDHFLAGFTLRDSPAFDEFQFFQTEGLKDGLAGALERLVRYHGDQEEYEPAIGYARRWLALDPLHEPAHRYLMTLYAKSGQQSAALRQYRLCLRTLEEELNVEPAAETTALYERIRAERARPAEPEVAVPKPLPSYASMPAFLTEEQAPAPVERPVFVAREQELAQLDGYLEAALAGRGQVVFVTGGPGRGKTALMGEFAQRAMEAYPDLLVAGGNCNAYSGVGDPYLPFREVLGMLTGDVEARWAAGGITQEHARRLWERLPLAAQALLAHGPHLVGPFVPGQGLLSRATAATEGGAPWLEQLREWCEWQRARSAGLEQGFLFEQYTNTLRALAARHPLLLLLDDLQWADSGSISLLFHLGRQMEGACILVASAYRPEEVALGRPSTSSGQLDRHPLEQVLAEFKRQSGDVWVDLERAEAQAGRRFLDALLDTEPNRLGEDFREALFHHTEGHPLFTVELLRAMQERGELSQDAQGSWGAGGVLDWETLPARVEGVIQARIGRLEEDLKDILTVASVEGEAFTAQVVARVQEIEERRLLRELSQELEKRHRLVREEGQLDVGRQRLSRFRFAHALFQAYLYNNLGTAERKLLHREVASVLEELFRDHIDEVAVQLGHHYDEAGDIEKAIEHMVRAGEQARLAYANEEAIGHYQRVLALLGPRSDPSVRDEGDAWRLVALRGLGQIHAGTGKPAEAEAYLREAVALGEEIGLVRRELVRLYHWLGEAMSLQDRADEQVRISEAGIALLQDDAASGEAVESVEAALMNQGVAAGYWGLGNLKEARELTYRTAQFLQSLPYSEELHTVYSHIILWLILDRDVEEAMRWLQVFEERAAARHHLTGVGQAHYWMGGALGLRGDLQGALSQHRQAAELFTTIGDVRMGGSAELCLADNCLSLGQLQEVEQHTRRGLAMIEKAEHTYEQPWAHWLIGRVALCRRDWEKALAVLQKALQLCREFEGDRGPWILHTLGRAYLAQGDRAQASRCFEEALASPPTGGWPKKPPAALGGLEQAYGDRDVFCAFCHRLREQGAHSSFLPLAQWVLEPAEVEAVREPPLLYDEFTASLSPGWEWRDPFCDCSFAVRNGLEIHAPNKRDLWFANLSAPRLLRPAPEHRDWAAQTVAVPASQEQPAVGGLLLWRDEQNYLRLDRGTAGEHEISFAGCLSNQDVFIGRGSLGHVRERLGRPLERARLRLECTEGLVRALCSVDGLVWFIVGEAEFPVDGPLQVGLHAIGDIDRTVYHGAYPDGTAIRFESFQLWRR